MRNLAEASRRNGITHLALEEDPAISSRFVNSPASVPPAPMNPNGSYHEPAFGGRRSTGFNSGSEFHGRVSCAHRAGSDTGS